MTTYSIKDLAEKLNCNYEGDGSIIIKGVAEITAAKEGDLSFVANPKYIGKLPFSKASAVIVHQELETDFRPVIWSSNPYLTFSKAIYLFHQDQRRLAGGVHPSAQVTQSVKLGKDITIMPHAIIEDDVVIGDRTIVYPGVFIGNGSVIGSDAILYPHVSIYSKCVVGDRNILHAGVRVGPSLVASLGQPEISVVLEADVELGANVVVSGFPQAPTSIGEGTKIDNLVQIGAGTEIGPHCIIVAQVTIGEQVTLKERVTIAGQVVVSPGVVIEERSRIGAKSVVVSHVPPDSDYWGVPAQHHSKEKRFKANIARLPKLFSRIQALEEYLDKSE